MANSGTNQPSPAQDRVPAPDLDAADSAAGAQLGVLVERLAGGDRLALCALYDLTAPTLLALARTVLPNEADAEEVIIDVYTQAWRSASRYQPSRGTVMAWLLMICRTRAIDRYRGERARSLDTRDPGEFVGAPRYAGSEPDTWLDTLQQGSALRAAIERLTPVRRQLIGLAFFRGLSHEEIATTTQLNLGTVKSHIRRALATLRHTLRDTQDRV